MISDVDMVHNKVVDIKKIYNFCSEAFLIWGYLETQIFISSSMVMIFFFKDLEWRYAWYQISSDHQESKTIVDFLRSFRSPST